MTVQYQNGYARFIRKGMNAWIAEEAVEMSDKPVADVVLEEINQNNAFQSTCEPQIMHTIADILLKKIRETS